MRKALHSYTKEFEKDLKKCTTLQQMIALSEKPIKSATIEAAMKKVYSPIGKQFGDQTYNSLKPKQKAVNTALLTPITEDYWFSWVEKLIKGSLGERIKVITGTTRDAFISAVDKIAYAGFEAGDGIPSIANAIMKELNIVERYRAERIARTEVISASNMSSQAGAQASGLELNKEWLSFIDDKTRQSHIDLNGTTVDINEEFSNGLQVPGDPSGEAEEVINCRCTVAYIPKDDAYTN